MNRHLFGDRSDAGRQLTQKLGYLQRARPLILALPRGGVPVGIEIASALHAPLDLLLVRKIGVPWHPELAAGAVIDGARPRTVIKEDVVRMAGPSQSDLSSIGRQGGTGTPATRAKPSVRKVSPPGPSAPSSFTAAGPRRPAWGRREVQSVNRRE
jgi:predicted phosphoribosyltransferase